MIICAITLKNYSIKQVKWNKNIKYLNKTQSRKAFITSYISTVTKFSPINKFTARYLRKNRKKSKTSLEDSLGVWDSSIIIIHKEFTNPPLFLLSEIQRSRLNNEKCFSCKKKSVLHKPCFYFSLIRPNWCS